MGSGVGSTSAGGGKFGFRVRKKEMGRVRGRGKKQTAVVAIEDAASGEEENIPTPRGRGRPQKPGKDRVVIVDEVNGDKALEKGDVPEEDAKTDDAAVATTIRKRKRSVKGQGGGDGNLNVCGEDRPELETKDVGMGRSAGFRTKGNRRKNKPQRAAEAGVEC